MLNQESLEPSLDRHALRQNLCRLSLDHVQSAQISAEDSPFFAAHQVFMARSQQAAMAELIQAIESVLALDAYRERVLAWAPEVALRGAQCQGVFLGYDFHVAQDGPRLIEINTNAGGALLNAVLAQSHRPVAPQLGRGGEEAAARFVEMFRAEWRAERGETQLATLAIVDEQPEAQFLFPEFQLFRGLFEQAGWQVLICDPLDLSYRDGALWWQDCLIDLVYNRLTDFSLGRFPALARAWAENAAVITPHPRAHALYADKRNLCVLSSPICLAELGVPPELRSILQKGIPPTELVRAENAEDLWVRRRGLFFKPASGFGSRAAYRGDKLTKRVFADILAGDYVAQALAPPGERRVLGVEGPVVLKVDVRQYVYAGQIQQSCARLYQGQTTNFRTPGGGFAPLVIIV